MPEARSDRSIEENAKKIIESNRQPAIRVLMMPRDTNANGTIFGGVILSHIDQAGAIEAYRHTRHRIVTVAMDKVVFKAPVHVGDIVSFYASTIRVGNTSITVRVDVIVEHRGSQIPVTEAELTFVAVDDNGKPVPVQ